MKPIVQSIFLLLLVTQIACNEKNISPEECACGKQDPFNELSWVQTFIDNETCTIYTGAQLFAYRYNSEDVLYLSNGASSNSACTDFLFDCSGAIFDLEVVREDFFSKRTDRRTLWTK